jgi:hypothetical protein
VINDFSCVRRNGAAQHCLLQIPFGRALEPGFFLCIGKAGGMDWPQGEIKWQIKAAGMEIKPDNRTGESGPTSCTK